LGINKVDRNLKDDRIHNVFLNSKNRTSLKKELDTINTLLKKYNYLTFYYHPSLVKVLAYISSNKNPNEDLRWEAYRIIGESGNLIFFPYLFNELKIETSYVTLSYIFYSLGCIGVEINRSVIDLIHNKYGSNKDENLAINYLYSIYKINEYNNWIYVDQMTKGISTVLSGGYSQKIKDICYNYLSYIKRISNENN
jgi:hypothetical protein